MKRSDIQELHYITPIVNLASIRRHGLLSHNRVQRLPSRSIAMPEIQERRERIRVPGGQPLHNYVNFYINARNPMLYKRIGHHAEICVLRLSPGILDLPGVVIADGNAASDYTAFWSPGDGLARVEQRYVFAEFWSDEDPIEAFRKKRRICAEVLVPDTVAQQYITGVYVSCDQAARVVAATGVPWPVTINGHLFFR